MISQMAKPKQREVLSISKWSKNGVRGGLIDHSLSIHRKSSRNRARKQSWLELQKIILQKQGIAALTVQGPKYSDSFEARGNKKAEPSEQ